MLVLGGYLIIHGVLLFVIPQDVGVVSPEFFGEGRVISVNEQAHEAILQNRYGMMIKVRGWFYKRHLGKPFTVQFSDVYEVDYSQLED